MIAYRAAWLTRRRPIVSDMAAARATRVTVLLVTRHNLKYQGQRFAVSCTVPTLNHLFQRCPVPQPFGVGVVMRSRRVRSKFGELRNGLSFPAHLYIFGGYVPRTITSPLSPLLWVCLQISMSAGKLWRTASASPRLYLRQIFGVPRRLFRFG